MIAKSCFRRLQLCYAKHEASPADMNKDGESVLDIFASRLSHLVGSTFLSLVTGMLIIGIYSNLDCLKSLEMILRMFSVPWPLLRYPLPMTVAESKVMSTFLWNMLIVL